jgi:putative ABC transport system permease protein
VTRAQALVLNVSRRCLSGLLLLYPGVFRARCGRAMLDLYSDRFEDAVEQRGLLAGLGLFLRTAVNVLTTGTAERLARAHVGSFGGRATADAAQSSGSSNKAGVLSRATCSVGADFLTGVKSIRRSFRVSLAAVGCIALGTASSIAVLTLYSSTALRPLPFPNAARLVRIWLADRDVGPRQQLRLPDVLDLETQLTKLDRFVAIARSRVMFLGDGSARRVEGEAITPGYFTLLRVEPLLGRVFLPDEYLVGSEPVMVLSYATWISHYGRDPSVLGSTIRTANRNYTVVGVMSPSFIGTIEEDFPDIEFWVPMIHDRTDEVRRSRVGGGYIWTLGRLGPGVALAQAQEEVRSIGARIAEAKPETRGPMAMRLERFGENWREGLRGRNYLLLAAAGLLLLVAAGNAAGLLTTRSLARRREMAVRVALGAGRTRLIRLVFAETFLLVIAGTGAGTLLAPYILHSFLNLAPDEVPDYVALTLDGRIMLLVLGVLAVTTLLAGTMPAALGSRVDPAGALRGRGATTGRRERRLGDQLVIAEVALTTVLIVTAGLLLRSYRALGETDLGFRTERVLRMAIFVDSRDVDLDQDLNTFNASLREAVLTYPGITGLGLVSPTVPPGTGGDARIRFADMPPASRAHGLPVHLHLVDPGFVPTMEIPLIVGRNVNSGDEGTTTSVCVVSESLADLMGGSRRALGQVIETDRESYEIVGVVGDVLYFGAVRRRQRNFDVYAPIAQAPTRLVSMAITTTGDPTHYVAALSERLHELAPRSPLDWVDPLTEALGSHFRSPRFYLLLLGSFAASALSLATVGLFATLASLVARQKGELGIRSALGATRIHLIGSVMYRGITIAGLGLSAGAAGGLVVSRVLGRTLYGVGTSDAITFVATATVIVCAAGLASYLPARRAAQVNPLHALQAD